MVVVAQVVQARHLLGDCVGCLLAVFAQSAIESADPSLLSCHCRCCRSRHHVWVEEGVAPAAGVVELVEQLVPAPFLPCPCSSFLACLAPS